MLDHLAQEQSGERLQTRAASPSGPYGIAKDPTEGRDVARQAIDADQKAQALRGPADHAHDGQDQAEIATLADHATQPEPRRYGHRHGHPEPPADRLDVEFVGLDMAQLDLPSEDLMVMDLPGMAAGPIAPIGDVRSSRPKAATIACSGQPWQSKVSTMITNSVGFLRR